METIGEADADPRGISGTAPDVRRAEDAWQEMKRLVPWKPNYLRDVRTNLSRALLLLAEPLAYVVNPIMYKGACGMTRYRAARSQTTTFLMHDCLPWRVRALSSSYNPEYAIVCRVGDALSNCLKRVSKAHMQTILFRFAVSRGIWHRLSSIIYYTTHRHHCGPRAATPSMTGGRFWNPCRRRHGCADMPRCSL